MEGTLCIPLGVIVERVKTDGRWRIQDWRAAGVMLGITRLQPGSVLWREGHAMTCFAGRQTLCLRPGDVAFYRDNLRQLMPRLYTVFNNRPGDNQPPTPKLITVAPHEAQRYADADASRVHIIMMPKAILDLVEAYIEEYNAPTVPPPRGRVSFKLYDSGGERTQKTRPTTPSPAVRS
jgi:hypothetical protein